MEWWLALVVILGGFLLLMATGMPVAWAFLLVNLIGVFIFWSGTSGLEQIILNIRESISNFHFLTLVMFILLGSVMFQSGIAPNMIDVLDKWLGRLPGRLSLLAIGSGTLLSTMSGSSMGSTALLGSVLVPEMEKHGYKKAMSLGPILGSGSLAIMIPPSSLGVLLAVLAQISIGRLLIAIIVPGLLMAAFYAIYTIGRCWLQPSLAPSYEVATTPLAEKLTATAKYVLPLGFIIFLVTGVIFLGIATPTEAAATGALGAFILAACYRRLNWEMVKKSVYITTEITVIMLIILAGAKTFSQLLAFTGATRGLVELSVGLPLAPIVIIIAMQLVTLVLGMFMSTVAVMMITLPIFMPIVQVLGFDPVWFGAIMLLNIEMGVTSPPFGLTLFVMKGVAPPGTTMGDVYRAAVPYLLCDLIVLVLMIAFPVVVQWLPGLMR